MLKRNPGPNEVNRFTDSFLEYNRKSTGAIGLGQRPLTSPVKGRGQGTTVAPPPQRATSGISLGKVERPDRPSGLISRTPAGVTDSAMSCASKGLSPLETQDRGPGASRALTQSRPLGISGRSTQR